MDQTTWTQVLGLSGMAVLAAERAADGKGWLLWGRGGLNDTMSNNSGPDRQGGLFWIPGETPCRGLFISSYTIKAPLDFRDIPEQEPNEFFRACTETPWNVGVRVVYIQNIQNRSPRRIDAIRWQPDILAQVVCA